MSLSLTIIGVERVVVSVVVDRQLLIVDDAMNWREKFEQSF